MFKVQTMRDRSDTEMVKVDNTQKDDGTEMDVINDQSQFSKASNEIGFEEFKSLRVSKFDDKESQRSSRKSSAKRTFEPTDFRAQFE